MKEVSTLIIGYIFILALFIDVFDLSQLLHKKA